MSKSFPKLTTLTPSKSNYPQKESQKNLIGFEQGTSYLMDTSGEGAELDLVGDVEASGSIGQPITTTITNKQIGLTGDILGSGQLGSNISAAIANKNIFLNGDVTGSGLLGGNINVSINNKYVSLYGDVSAYGQLGDNISVVLNKKNITLSGDLSGSGEVGGIITAGIVNKQITLVGEVTGSNTLGNTIQTTLNINKNITLDGDVYGAGVLGGTIQTIVQPTSPLRVFDDTDFSFYANVTKGNLLESAWGKLTLNGERCAILETNGPLGGNFYINNNFAVIAQGFADWGVMFQDVDLYALNLPNPWKSYISSSGSLVIFNGASEEIQKQPCKKSALKGINKLKIHQKTNQHKITEQDDLKTRLNKTHKTHKIEWTLDALELEKHLPLASHKPIYKKEHKKNREFCKHKRDFLKSKYEDVKAIDTYHLQMYQTLAIQELTERLEKLEKLARMKSIFHWRNNKKKRET